MRLSKETCELLIELGDEEFCYAARCWHLPPRNDWIVELDSYDDKIKLFISQNFYYPWKEQ